MLLVKQHLHSFITDLQKLNSKCLSYHQQLQYQNDDLRKSIFAKLCLLFTNLGIHADLLLNDDSTIELAISKWNYFNINGKQQSIQATFRENFLKFTMRSTYSESLELVEHLIASILETMQLKKEDEHLPFSKMVKKIKSLGIIDETEQCFLLNWANNYRNPRHRNYKNMLFSFPHNFTEFHKLLKIITKFASHLDIQTIGYIKDDLPQ